MILYLIRHGRPDYKTDTLLPDGIEQAKLAAQRLMLCGIDEINASTMGRAAETAMELSKLNGLPVIPQDWARELGDESRTHYPDGEAKTISALPPYLMHQNKYQNIPTEYCFDLIDGMNDSNVRDKYNSVASGLDAWLADHGYVRNGNGSYDAVAPNDRHIALFAHAGMGRVMVSHLLNIPYQLTVNTFACYFTGITIFDFNVNVRYTGQNIPIVPYLAAYGDIGHLHLGGMPTHGSFTKSII